MLSIIIAILGSGSLSAIITNLLNVRQNRAKAKEIEAKAKETEAKAECQELINVQKLIDINNQFIDQLVQARQEIAELVKKVDELTQANEQLKKHVKALQSDLKKFNHHENRNQG